MTDLIGFGLNSSERCFEMLIFNNITFIFISIKNFVGNSKIDQNDALLVYNRRTSKLHHIPIEMADSKTIFFHILKSKIEQFFTVDAHLPDNKFILPVNINLNIN